MCMGYATGSRSVWPGRSQYSTVGRAAIPRHTKPPNRPGRAATILVLPRCYIRVCTRFPPPAGGRAGGILPSEKGAKPPDSSLGTKDRRPDIWGDGKVGHRTNSLVPLFSSSLVLEATLSRLGKKRGKEVPRDPLPTQYNLHTQRPIENLTHRRGFPKSFLDLHTAYVQPDPSFSKKKKRHFTIHRQRGYALTPPPPGEMFTLLVLYSFIHALDLV